MLIPRVRVRVGIQTQAECAAPSSLGLRNPHHVRSSERGAKGGSWACCHASAPGRLGYKRHGAREATSRTLCMGMRDAVVTDHRPRHMYWAQKSFTRIRPLPNGD
jgi:hypothetical protein